MSTVLDEYRRKAQGILPGDADSETILSIAFYLMEKENEKKVLKMEIENEKKVLKIEMEKENEKKVLKIEKENEMKVLKIEMEKENEKKMQMQKSADELRQAIAFHSKQLSAVVQRLVVCL
jgi:diaminopimelate epimerase